MILHSLAPEHKTPNTSNLKSSQSVKHSITYPSKVAPHKVNQNNARQDTAPNISHKTTINTRPACNTYTKCITYVPINTPYMTQPNINPKAFLFFFCTLQPICTRTRSWHLKMNLLKNTIPEKSAGYWLHNTLWG